MYSVKFNHETVDVVDDFDRVVGSFGRDRNKAKKLARHLNSGGGFDKIIPDFFLNRIRINAN